MKKITEIEEHSYSIEGHGCAIASVIFLALFLILAVILGIIFIIISLF